MFFKLRKLSQKQMVWNLMFPWFYSTRAIFPWKMCQTLFLLFNHMGLSQNWGAAINPMVWNRKSSQRNLVNDPHIGPTQMSCWWTICHHIIIVKHTSYWWIPFSFDKTSIPFLGLLEILKSKASGRVPSPTRQPSCHPRESPAAPDKFTGEAEPSRMYLAIHLWIQSLLADCLSQEKLAGAGWSSSHPRGTSVFWPHCRYLMIQSLNTCSENFRDLEQ